MIAGNREADLFIDCISSVLLAVNASAHEHSQEIEIGGSKGEGVREDDFAVVETSLEGRIIRTANGEVPFQVIVLRA